jgi:hypothetical protein
MLNLLLLPVTGPLDGVTWIAGKLLEQAEGETNDLEVLQKQLLALQLSFDMGELDEETFEAQEEELLLAIEALQQAEAED